MAFIYILHELYDYFYPEHKSDPYELGKKFARIAILSFIFYYIFYFSFPIDSGYRHFLGRMIYVDVLSSVVFYGGLVKFLDFWSKGENKKNETVNVEKIESD